MSQTHDNYSEHSSPKVGSNRTFGLTIGGVLLAFTAYRWWLRGLPEILAILLATVALVLIAVAIAAPARLASLNRLWMRLGLMIGRIVNPIIMFAIFAIIFVPYAYIMRLAGRDALRLKRDRRILTYWIDRDSQSKTVSNMQNQF